MHSGESNMVLFGTIINALAIVIGSILGLFLTKIHEKYKETIMHGIALTVIVIGLQMAMKANSIIIVLLSILTGAIVGEMLKLEDRLNRLGVIIASKFSKDNASTVAQAFVTASLLYVVGAMAIVGALNSGLRGDHELLLTKSVLDGFTSIVLTTTLGVGVILSVLPVTLFQGGITLLATRIDRVLPDIILEQLILEITAVGGILIMAIGLNLLKVTNIRVVNLIPSLFTVGLIMYMAYSLQIN